MPEQPSSVRRPQRVLRPNYVVLLPELRHSQTVARAWDSQPRSWASWGRGPQGNQLFRRASPETAGRRPNSPAEKLLSTRSAVATI